MSSKIIYQRTPYFYVIRHIQSQKLYAGAKWAVGCYPDTFMTEDGYQTSSTKVKALIQHSGLESFEVVQILTKEECGINVLDYESLFLQKNDCAGSDDWLNGHNNFGHMAFGTKYFSDLMLEKYGVTDGMKLQSTKQKIEKTNLKRYGFANPGQVPEFKQKIEETNLERYGFENPFQVPEFKSKAEETNLERYGVNNAMKSPVIQLKFEKNIILKYGVKNVSQIPASRLKISKALKGVPKPAGTGAKVSATKKLTGSSIGHRNPSFKYWFHTPFGITDTTDNFEPGKIIQQLRYWCVKCDRKICKITYNRSEYLLSNYTFEELKDKTYRDIGFYTLTKEEYSNLKL
jgi:hypothetical protein